MVYSVGEQKVVQNLKPSAVVENKNVAEKS